MMGSDSATAAHDVESLGHGANCLMALHGIQGTRAAWMPAATELSDQFRVVMPNLRGRGHAWRGRAPTDYTLSAFAEEAASIATEHIGAKPFFLAGWSMGVSVALQYLNTAGVAPRPVGLILLSGSPCLCDTRWFGAPGDALLGEIAERKRRLGLREAADHDAVAWTWEALRSTDQRALLGTIDLPTLIVHGSDDEDSPWLHALELRDGLANAELITINGGRHSLLTQNTAVVVQHMRRFVDAVLTSRKAPRETR